MEVNIYQPDPAFTEEVRAYARDKVEWSLDTFDRYEREDRSNQVKEETVAHFAEAYPDSEKDVDSILYTLTKEIVRDKIINRTSGPTAVSRTRSGPSGAKPASCPAPMAARCSPGARPR